MPGKPETLRGLIPKKVKSQLKRISAQNTIHISKTNANGYKTTSTEKSNLFVSDMLLFLQ